MSNMRALLANLPCATQIPLISITWEVFWLLPTILQVTGCLNVSLTQLEDIVTCMLFALSTRLGHSLLTLHHSICPVDDPELAVSGDTKRDINGYDVVSVLGWSCFVFPPRIYLLCYSSQLARNRPGIRGNSGSSRDKLTIDHRPQVLTWSINVSGAWYCFVSVYLFCRIFIRLSLAYGFTMRFPPGFKSGYAIVDILPVSSLTISECSRDMFTALLKQYRAYTKCSRPVTDPSYMSKRRCIGNRRSLIHMSLWGRVTSLQVQYQFQYLPQRSWSTAGIHPQR